MENQKDDRYFIDLIKTDLQFIVEKTKDLKTENMRRDEVLVDSAMFRMIQISENADRLTEEFKQSHPNIPWREIKGMRNRIVHNYGHVDMTVVFETIHNDIPKLLDLFSCF